MATGIIDRVRSGFADALRYDRHRPSYPASSIQTILQEGGVSSVRESRILDIGAGTGILTAQLAALPESFEIIAIEPHDDMRQVLLQRSLDRVRVIDAVAAQMGDVATAWADAVFIGQAFHWFANLESLQEIHRIMKPGAVLGMMWNLEDYSPGSDWIPTTQWEDVMRRVIRDHDVHDSRSGHKEWQDAFAEQASHENAERLFTMPLRQQTVSWTVWLSRDAIWNRYSTLSQIAAQEGPELEETRRIIHEAMTDGDVEANDIGKIALHGRTETYWTFALALAEQKDSD